MGIPAIDFTEGIGFVAAACTTLSFIPQLIKIRKQGGRDLSYSMLAIYLFGLALWLVYGLRLHAPAVIAANIVGLILVGASLAMKRVRELQEALPSVTGNEAGGANPLELFPEAEPAEQEVKTLNTYSASIP
jgi:MtN3 and saliva related transmembrane protein